MSVATPVALGFLSRWNPAGTAYKLSTYESGQLQGMQGQHTERAWAALSSGEASGSNWKAAIPAFLDSSAMTRSASYAVAPLLGS